MTYSTDLYSSLNINSDSHCSYSSPFSRLQRIDRSFLQLGNAFNAGLNKTLKPAIYLFSASCGLGKSKALQSFIQRWKADGLSGSGSILIALATIAEIASFVDGCRLDRGDYAVMASDPETKLWGLGKANAGVAKVLFTTHEQLRRRTAEHDRFADVSCFHYRGRPRPLRVWDEGLLAAPYASFPLNAMRALPYAIGATDPALSAAIAKLLPAEDTLSVGGTLPIPAALGTMIAAYGRRTAAFDNRQQQALEGLAKLAGYDAHIRKDNLYGWTLVGAGKPLPRDIAPMIVMDASAPLMSRYDDWSAYGFNVHRLTPAEVVYDGLSIRWWDRASGKTALNNLTNRREVIGAVAKLINEKPHEQWLVVHYRSMRRTGEKDGELPRDLSEQLDKPGNVKSVHWGLHTATNVYRSIRNVVLIGALDYGTGAYEAITRASTGKNEAPSLAMLKATRDG